MSDESTVQVADLVCSLCGWHVMVWRSSGPGIVKSTDFYGPADALFEHIEATHSDGGHAPQLPRCVDCGRPMPTGRCTLTDCFSTWGKTPQSAT